MRISCLLGGAPLTFDIDPVDEWEGGTVYRVRSGPLEAFYETFSRRGLQELAEAGIVALTLDQLSDIKEVEK